MSATSFSRKQIAADGLGAAQARVEFGRWLQRHFAVDNQRLSDLILAVNEALANAAEFAYLDAPKGTVDMHAAYDSGVDTMTVTVDDRGRWRQPVPESPAVPPHRRLRGRGIPLMHALADRATIDTTSDGTHVTLTWTNLLKAVPNTRHAHTQ